MAPIVYRQDDVEREVENIGTEDQPEKARRGEKREKRSNDSIGGNFAGGLQKGA